MAFSIRMTPDEYDLLQAMASSQGIPPRELARRAIRALATPQSYHTSFSDVCTRRGSLEISKSIGETYTCLLFQGSLHRRLRELPDSGAVFDGALHEAFLLVVKRIVERLDKDDDASPEGAKDNGRARRRRKS